MKNKRKIILAILTFLCFTIKVQAKTNYIENGNVIPNSNLYLKINNEEKFISLREIKNTSTGDLLYSINPEKEFSSDNLNVYNYFWLIDLDKNLYKEVSKIIYYGYGYNDRATINWYIATQYLVWDYILKEPDEIYFVDENHNKINLYEEEIKTIKDDIAKMYTMPSFVEENFFTTIATLKINEEITFTDNNNVLQDMVMPYIGSSNITREDNKITVSFTAPGDHSLIFTREFLAEKERQIYKNNDSPVLLSRGTIDPYSANTYLKILYPSFTLNLIDEANTSLSKKDALYGIYYEPGELYGTYKTDEEGKIYLNEMYTGSFFYQELETPYGFKPNSEKLYFKVKSDDVTFNIKKKAILKKVNIKKNLVDGNNIESGCNTTYNIIDASTNKIYKEVTTDSYGKSSFNLPFGTFIIREINSLEDYTKPDDITIEINENYNENDYINITSTKIKGNIKITTFDDKHNPLLEKITFKIKDLNTNTYLQNKESEIYEIINGCLNINNLPYGNYQLEQISSPKNYDLSNNINFKITEDKTINISIINKYHNKEENIENIIADNSNTTTKIEVPKTGSKETLITLIICVLGLILGVYICNYNENK